jgi:hypothetical protein
VCRENNSGVLNSANQSIRKVNAALVVAEMEPLECFRVQRPLAFKAHIEVHRHTVLKNYECPKGTAATLNFNRDAANTQAQMMAFYYYVRSTH